MTEEQNQRPRVNNQAVDSGSVQRVPPQSLEAEMGTLGSMALAWAHLSDPREAHSK